MEKLTAKTEPQFQFFFYRCPHLCPEAVKVCEWMRDNQRWNKNKKTTRTHGDARNGEI